PGCLLVAPWRPRLFPCFRDNSTVPIDTREADGRLIGVRWHHQPNTKEQVMAKKSRRVIDLENRVSELEAKLADTEARLAATEQQLRNTEQELLGAMAPKAPTAPKAAATPKTGSRQERDAEVTRLANERGLEARRVGLNTWEILNICQVAGKLDYWQNRQEW